MGMTTSYFAFSCMFLILFVAKQNICVHVDSSEEASALLKFIKIENPNPNEKEFAREIVAIKEEISKLDKEINPIRIDKEKREAVVVAVVSREVLESFFTKNVQKYVLPAGEPGEIYVEAQIQSAYENFLNDSENEVAKAVRELFPGKVQKLPQAISKLYRKLSGLNRAFYKGLKISMKLEDVKKFIQILPAPMNEDEITLVENIIQVINRFDPLEYFDYPL